MNETIKQRMIQSLGLGALPPAEQDEALNRVGRILFQAVLMRAAEDLEESKQEELSRLLGADQPDPQQLMAFLQTNVPDFETIMREEVARFKEESAKVVGIGKN